MQGDITNSYNRQHYIILLSTGPSSELIFLIWTWLPWALYTIFTRQQLLLIAVYKTSPLFYKHQQSTPFVLINSFVSELESQFNHRKCTFKRNKDVRAGFDMLCEIGRYIIDNIQTSPSLPLSLSPLLKIFLMQLMLAIYLSGEVTTPLLHSIVKLTLTVH